MPLYRRLPKRGFNSIKKENVAMINLIKIQNILKDKRISGSSKINLELLQKSNLINKKYKKLKLLGMGEVKDKFEIETNFISKTAKDKIEKSGGKVILIK